METRGHGVPVGKCSVGLGRFFSLYNSLSRCILLEIQKLPCGYIIVGEGVLKPQTNLLEKTRSLGFVFRVIYILKSVSFKNMHLKSAS